jgi:hypothetical protein
MVDWVVSKIGFVTKIGIGLGLYGQFPTTCLGPLQKEPIWALGVESIVKVGIIQII